MQMAMKIVIFTIKIHDFQENWASTGICEQRPETLKEYFSFASITRIVKCSFDAFEVIASV